MPIPTGVPINSVFGSHFVNLESIGRFISVILENSFVVAGVVLLFLLILGGFLIIRGAGSSKPDDVAAGQKAATAALAGFVVIFVSYWIVQLIELITGIPILE